MDGQNHAPADTLRPGDPGRRSARPVKVPGLIIGTTFLVVAVAILALVIVDPATSA